MGNFKIVWFGSAVYLKSKSHPIVDTSFTELESMSVLSGTKTERYIIPILEYVGFNDKSTITL